MDKKEPKSVFIEGRDLDETWYKILYELYYHGRTNHIDSGSYSGANRLEFDYLAGTILNPTIRPLSPSIPDGVPQPTTDKKIEEYFTRYIMDGHNLEGNEHYRYATWISGGFYRLPKATWYEDMKDGTRLRNFGSNSLVMKVPDQVQWCIDHYKKKGHGNNHCYIQVGYPESSFAYDIPYENENERQTSPCLRGIDNHIKDGVLHFAVVFRSWDLYSGFPENMGGITMLMEYMANELEVKTGPLSFSSLKAHAYDFQIDALKARLNI